MFVKNGDLRSAGTLKEPTVCTVVNKHSTRDLGDRCSMLVMVQGHQDLAVLAVMN